ncbi:Reverse transcriptase-like [Sesbania bispinosa]|nr:Reverse transcriptase-like [Sesbania bispinosa]
MGYMEIEEQLCIHRILNSSSGFNLLPGRKTGAIAVVVRDHSGNLLAGLARKIPTPSPLAAEGIALRDAILMAYNLNWNRVRQGNKAAHFVAQASLTDSLPLSWVGTPSLGLLSIFREDLNFSSLRHHASSSPSM